MKRMAYGTLAIALAAWTVTACQASAQQTANPDLDPKTLKAFAGTWTMVLEPEEERTFREQKIEVPTLTIAETGAWTWRFLDETRTGTVKTVEGALVFQWEKVNGKAPDPMPTQETRGLLSASEPVQLLLTSGPDQTEFRFERRPASAEQDGGPANPGQS
jgi:hypothetical protein